jgi:hypothetical protein
MCTEILITIKFYVNIFPNNLVHIAIIDTGYEIAVERDQHQWTKQITAPKTQSACLTRVARRVFKIEAIWVCV